MTQIYCEKTVSAYALLLFIFLTSFLSLETKTQMIYPRITIYTNILQTNTLSESVWSRVLLGGLWATPVGPYSGGAGWHKSLSVLPLLHMHVSIF